jgi:hypothetical protein
MADRVLVSDRRPSRVSRDAVIGAPILLAAAVALRFLIHYAFPYFRFDPVQFDYFWPHRFRLIYHICGGMLALSCGPFQFWTGLRMRAMTFHMWTGRLYLVGVGVGSTGAFLMAVYTKPQSYAVSLISLAIGWILITAIAYTAILRGMVGLHKEWMVRSYITTFVFVTVRLLADNLPRLAAPLGGSPEDRLANMTWISWLLPLGIYELILQSRRIFGTKQPA